MDRSSDSSSRTLLTAGNIAVDAVTAEVVNALRAEGIRSLLLKGPAIVTWLYAEGAEPHPGYDDAEPVRSYDDVDLLVAPDDLDSCKQVLGRLGFANRFAAFAPGEFAEHSTEWWRVGSPVAVDLHRTLQGVRASPNKLSGELASGAEELMVGGTRVEVPSKAGRALVVALHAAYHGVREPKPLGDVRRAIHLVDPAVWVEAAQLAERLSATPAFAAGLMLVPEGASLADRLEVADAVDTEAALLSQSPAPTAYGFARLAATPGLRGKMVFLARELIPTPAFTRYVSPLARRGRMGLTLAYLWRPVSLLLHAGPGVLAWLRARRYSNSRGS
jgi:Uncharacterised nucleotidyltransferase